MVDSPEGGDVRLEWGQLLQIERGQQSEGDSEEREEPVRCAVYALFRQKRQCIGYSGATWLKDGAADRRLYELESLVDLLMRRIRVAHSRLPMELQWVLQKPLEKILDEEQHRDPA